MSFSTSSAQKTGVQQEGEHGWVQHVQGEHYQRNVLRVFMIERGLVGNPESSLVHRRSPKSINQSPNSKFLGLSLSTPVWFLLQLNKGTGLVPIDYKSSFLYFQILSLINPVLNPWQNTIVMSFIFELILKTHFFIYDILNRGS